MSKLKRVYESDLMDLVKMVEERPCIWDKSCITSITERKEAWKEISRRFAPVNYDEMTIKDQAKLEDNLRSRWKNMRDTFIKSKRMNLNTPYKYNDNLMFLLRCPILRKQLLRSAEKSQTDKLRPRTHLKTMNSSFGSELEQNKLLFPTETVETKPIILQQKNVKLTPSAPETNVNSVNSTTTKDSNKKNGAPDEDEAFFISVIPSVKKLTDEEKLEFRMGVLNTIKEINSKLKMNQSTAFQMNQSAALQNAGYSGLLFVCDREMSELTNGNPLTIQ